MGSPGGDAFCIKRTPKQVKTFPLGYNHTIGNKHTESYPINRTKINMFTNNNIRNNLNKIKNSSSISHYIGIFQKQYNHCKYHNTLEDKFGYVTYWKQCICHKIYLPIQIRPLPS